MNKLKFKPIVEKLQQQLAKNGIGLDLITDTNNVIITKLNDVKSFKIAKECFYRYSGSIAVLYKTKDDKSFEIIEVTDEMYIMNYIKVSIETFFNINKK